MSQQAHIFVEKQGSIQKSNWSSRILTIDTATATATVSRKNDPQKKLHHTLRVMELRKFPNVDLTHAKVDAHSIEAKWTLCLRGHKAPIPDLSKESTEAVEPYKREIGAAEGQSSESSDLTPQVEHTPGTKSSATGRKSSTTAMDHWLIRCTSQDTYDLAVKLLEAILHATDKAAAKLPQDAA